jgi:insecticidal toxin complex protein TccC
MAALSPDRTFLEKEGSIAAVRARRPSPDAYEDAYPALSVGRSSQLGETAIPFENLSGTAPEFAQGGKNWGGIVRDVADNTFKVTDVDVFMEKVARVYQNAGEPLADQVAKAIRDYVSSPGKVFSGGDGIPGLHAEVRTLTYFQSLANESKIELDYSSLTIGTLRTPSMRQPGIGGNNFPACANCSGILPREVNVPTGRVN